MRHPPDERTKHPSPELYGVAELGEPAEQLRRRQPLAGGVELKGDLDDRSIREETSVSAALNTLAEPGERGLGSGKILRPWSDVGDQSLEDEPEEVRMLERIAPEARGASLDQGLQRILDRWQRVDGSAEGLPGLPIERGVEPLLAPEGAVDRPRCRARRVRNSANRQRLGTPLGEQGLRRLKQKLSRLRVVLSGPPHRLTF